ncbi:hypothetical protein Q9L58_001340 [Maublancomyces gigas]|uniref:C2H2-type domain-containing protein n=1 Tax=Discina gigas TaxID=1032678 RepID=A0ABR3GUA3_9PEZI
MALEQHLANSPVHQPTYTCDDCDRDFINEDALDQHLNSSVHVVTQFHCCECDQDFNSEVALEQHLRDKPHKPQQAARAEFFCGRCEKEFGDGRALRQHLNSVIHHPLIDNVKCISHSECSKRFMSPSAMLHHLESGACSSGMTRRKIDRAILQADTENLLISGVHSGGMVTDASITNSSSSTCSSSSSSSSPGILTPSSSSLSTNNNNIVSILAGKSCPLCSRRFQSAQALWAHMCSPAHSPKIYHCPLPFMEPDGRTGNFSTFSGLTQHLESGACNGGKETFRKAMRLVNQKLRELGLADMRLIG